MVIGAVLVVVTMTVVSGETVVVVSGATVAVVRIVVSGVEVVIGAVVGSPSAQHNSRIMLSQYLPDDTNPPTSP